MSDRIDNVAVLGAGTMGRGIAAACACAGCQVLLLDVSLERAERAFAAMTEGRAPALTDRTAMARIRLGSLDDDLAAIRDYDWVCEAVVEDLAVKRALFATIEPLRGEGSVVSTNTSGIPLRAITAGMPDRLRRDMVVTHFFNPVNVMKLLEIVPGAETSPETVDRLTTFGGERLGKGVVHAKDTVNFIGNRIGCFWMLSGLHKAKRAIGDGLSMERIDALMGDPVGIPRTGLYGLIDLIGLDVMELVGRNLAANLPDGDPRHAFVELPEAERAMLARRQLGRKTGGGFYRLAVADDGGQSKETFDLAVEAWRPIEKVVLDAPHDRAKTLLFADDAEGRFADDLMGGTLAYAADLVPEIADDIVNIDRAMRWGFNWTKGPFELLDAIGPVRVIASLEAKGKALPRMFQTLKDADGKSFYRAGGTEYLGRNGAYHPIPGA